LPTFSDKAEGRGPAPTEELPARLLVERIILAEQRHGAGEDVELAIETGVLQRSRITGAAAPALPAKKVCSPSRPKLFQSVKSAASVRASGSSGGARQARL